MLRGKILIERECGTKVEEGGEGFGRAEDGRGIRNGEDGESEEDCEAMGRGEGGRCGGAALGSGGGGARAAAQGQQRKGGGSGGSMAATTVLRWRRQLDQRRQR